MRLLPALVLLVACGRDQQPPPPGASVLIPERAPAHTPAARPASLGHLPEQRHDGAPFGSDLPQRARRVGVEPREPSFRSVEVRLRTEGVKREGVGWYEDGDATTYDVAIQRAIFNGEARYG